MTLATLGNWGVYGHDWAVDHLRRGILNDRIRQAYLIIGMESVGKETLAKAFIAAMLCTDPDPACRPCGQCSACRRIVSGNHPDMLFAEKEGDDHALKIDAIRALMGRLALKPFEGRYRFGIFPDFDQIRPQAQDALLKTLEEPAPHAILILMARTIESVLPTITSRSQILHLRPTAIAEVETVLRAQPGVDADKVPLWAHLSGGRIGWALRAAHDPEALTQRTAGIDLLEAILRGNRTMRFNKAADLAKDKDALATLLTLWQSYWRDALLIGYDAPMTAANIDREDALRDLALSTAPEDILKALQATNRLLDRLPTNINLRLALEVTLLDYPGLVR